jgi:regulator of replication initiation timing
MTGKRYYLENYKDFTVITLRLYDDEIEHNHYDWLTDCNKIVDLLNTLNAENEQLRHDATILIQSNQDYRRENEELKHRLAISEKANFVTALEEENEQLQQTCSHYEKRIMELKDEISELKGETRVIVGDLE